MPRTSKNEIANKRGNGTDRNNTTTNAMQEMYASGYRQGQIDAFWSIVNEIFDHIGSGSSADKVCKALLHMSEDQGFPVPGACSNTKTSALNFTNVDLNTFFVQESRPANGPKNGNRNQNKFR